MNKRRLLLDAKGEVCPYPALYAGAMLEGMVPGEVFEILVDHLCAVEGIPAAVEQLGHRVLSTEAVANGVYRIVVEVGGQLPEETVAGLPPEKAPA